MQLAVFMVSSDWTKTTLRQIFRFIEGKIRLNPVQARIAVQEWTQCLSNRESVDRPGGSSSRRWVGRWSGGFDPSQCPGTPVSPGQVCWKTIEKYKTQILDHTFGMPCPWCANRSFAILATPFKLDLQQSIKWSTKPSNHKYWWPVCEYDELKGRPLRVLQSSF